MLSDFRTKKMTLMFKLWDLDGDGRIEAADFDQMTANFGDAYDLSPGSQEYENMHTYYRNMWEGLAGMDADSDGTIGLDEYLAGTDAWLSNRDVFMTNLAGMVDAFFAVVDQNADGSISEDELVKNYGIHGIEPSRGREAYRHLDAEGRGGVTRDQMLGYFEQLYYSEDPVARGNWLVLALEGA